MVAQRINRSDFEYKLREEDIQHYLSLGADAVLIKPYYYEKIINKYYSPKSEELIFKKK
ncbi:hypothetical protein [Rickettsiella massiliensis]|uniref:hypothetical protein n=1 Tax=Rickettsiella massiliensis TaxID=676517 RepID=UPI0012EB01F5|nr:hypothetical protein [Rickettsiella massiliensis]